jgi:PEP-CTERM motif
MARDRVRPPGMLTIALASGMLCAPHAATADAIITLTGPTSNAGTIDLSTAPPGQYGGLVTVGSTTGFSLWGLLGGTNASNPNSPIYGAITTTTPAGDNGKNAILRYYVLATGASGSQSLISLGEIYPNFSGSAAPDLVTFSGNTASLVFTRSGAAARDVTNLASLQLLSVPSLPLVTSAPPSTSVTLAGNVSHPGAYKFQGSDPQNVSPITETVNGDTYTGPPFFALIDPNDPNILNQYVVTAGTDGYLVLLSLAELDPAFGASTAINQVDLVPYADTGGNFPGAALARTILPGDTLFAHGRWVSNLFLIDVAAVPEPATIALLMAALIGMAMAFCLRPATHLRRPIRVAEKRGRPTPIT